MFQTITLASVGAMDKKMTRLEKKNMDCKLTHYMNSGVTVQLPKLYHLVDAVQYSVGEDEMDGWAFFKEHWFPASWKKEDPEEETEVPIQLSVT